jgi:NarL family two-component system response regulator LiaR
MNNERISIFIVDDSEVFRLGMSVAMERQSCFEVIKEQPDALNLADQISRLNPDVVLIDVTMTSSNAVDLIKQVRAESPSVKFLALTPQLDSEQIWSAYSNGADGHCTKGIRTDWLVSGIKTVAAGAKWASPQTVDALISASRISESDSRLRKPSKSANGQLSAREQEVLALLVQGFSNTEIGSRLYLSPETIKTHVRHIMEKLSVRDRTHAAVEAVRRGLVTAC